MRVVHLSLLVLVCMSAACSGVSQSHAQTMDLKWLDPVLASQIEIGKLTLMIHDSPSEIPSYKPINSGPILHIWKDKKTLNWQYKIIHYTSNGEIIIDEIQESNGSLVNFEGSFTDTISAKVTGSNGANPARTEEEPTLGPEPTPTPSLNPNPESSATQTGFEHSDWQEKTTTEIPEKTPSLPEETQIETEVSISSVTETTEPTKIIEPTEYTKTKTVLNQVPVTFIQNGEVITVFRELDSKKVETKVFQETALIWNEEKTISEVTEIISKFSEIHGKELDTDSYTLFNNIASTETDKYWSEYNYWHVKVSQLEQGIRAISKTFKKTINERDVAALAQAIRECKNGHVAAILDTDDIDKNSVDGWDVHAEMFSATCSKDSDKVQFFAWSGSKSGIYVTGRYSEFNKMTVRDTIRRWLFSHVGMLVQCSSSPDEEMAIWSRPELSMRTSVATASATVSVNNTLTSTTSVTATATNSQTKSVEATILNIEQSDTLDTSF